MVKKALNEVKKSRTTVKASLLPPLRVEVDKELAKQCLMRALELAKESSPSVKFGMKSALRSIRRQTAQLVFVEATLPRVIIDSFAGYKKLITMDGLEAKAKKSSKEMKLKRCSFVTVLKHESFEVPNGLFKTEKLCDKKFSPNIDIYTKN